jgi:hypothetical protein
MKHATADTLAALQPLLAQLRTIGRLVERTPGCFYLKSSAFLHFHEDATGIFADVKFDPASFSRVRVTSAAEQARLVQDVRRCLGDANARRPG